MINEHKKIRYFGFRKLKAGDSMRNVHLIIETMNHTFFDVFLLQFYMNGLSIDDLYPPEFEMIFQVHRVMTAEEVLIECLIGDINQAMESAKPMSFVAQVIHAMKSIFPNSSGTDTYTRCIIRIKHETVFQDKSFEIELKDNIQL